MVIFLIIAVVGLLFSVIAHIGIYLGYNLDSLLMTFEVSNIRFSVLGIGLLILTPFIGICSESMVSKKYDKEIRKKAFTTACPRWIWISALICFIYAFAVIAYYCISGYLVYADIKFIKLLNLDTLKKGITSVYVATYATAIPLYLYYITLKKLIRDRKLNDEFYNSL